MTIFGIDCSDFDWDRGPMDVGAMVRDGISFLTHKATEGTKIVHSHYGEALNRAEVAGMPFKGAYVVVRTPGNNGHGPLQEQVNFFLSYLDSQTPWWWTDPGFFLQVDTEHWGYDDVAPQYGAQMCDLLRAQTGKTVIHYAPRWAYGDSIPGDHPLWASAYGTNPAVPYRNGYPGDGASAWTPYSGRTPAIVQYGSRLTIGTQPGCDGNAFRGTIDQFRALITGGKGMTQQAESILWAQALGMPSFTADDGKVYPYVGTSWEIARTKWQATVDATLAEIKANLTRPATAVTLSDADRKAIVDALVAHPDTPLGAADKPAITAALDEFFAKHFGPVSAPVTPTV